MPEPRWLRIGNICSIEKGVTGLAAATPGQYPLVATGAERRSAQTYQFDTPAVCIPLVSSTGHGKKTLNHVHYQEGKFALGTILAAVIPKDEKVLDARYLHTYLQMNKDRVLVPLMRGAANVSLSVSAILDINIPVPPLAEQKKALSKLDSMSGEHAELLQETDKQLELLKQLRQQILQDAIEGKLTAAWRKKNSVLITGENHASKLLKKALKAKNSLIRSGDIRESREISGSVTIRNIQIPAEWTWVKGEDIFFVTKLAGFEYTKHIKLSISGEVPVIRAQNVRPVEITKESLQFIDLKTSKILERSALTKKCLLVTFIGAGIGDVATFNEKARWHLAPNVAKMEPYGAHEYLNVKFLNYYLLSRVGQREILKHVKATAQPCLSMGTIRDIDYPIPPIAEQKIIVEAVDRAMSTIDELVKQVGERKNQSEMLMQSVLREAFEGK